MTDDRERELTEKEPDKLTTSELLQLLKLRHTGDEPPPCPVCGGAMSPVHSGRGPTKWACTMWETDPDNEGKLRRKSNRRLLDDHFAESVWYQYVHDEPWVLELVRRVESWGAVVGDTSMVDI